MQQERPDHTLQPTASANEAYLRLIGQSRVDWKSRAHFFAIAAAMMRRVLVDHARQCRAAKRGGSAQKVTLTEAMGASDASNVDLLALDEPWRKRPPVCAATTGYDQGVKTALSEVLQRAGEFFLGKSPIHAAAGRIAKALAEMNIPFAVAGALAANVHGHTRTTEVVDILLTAEGLAKFRERWLGRGWVEQFPGSRGLRDSVHEINIDVILTGDYPGDGKPKPVAFPDPEQASEPDPEGVPVLTLPALITLKLASGMTAAHRPRDLDDVIQLIRRNDLDREYTQQLDPYVREKYLELWEAAQVQDEY